VEPLALALRALFAFVVLLLSMRLSGKRSISQATPFDFVLALVVGDMVDDVSWREVNPSQFVVGVAMLAGAHTLVAFIASRSDAFADVVNGRPRLLMEDGEPLVAGLRAERLGRKELFEVLREKGLPRRRWRDVAEARLEESGELSVSLREAARPLQKADLEARRGRGSRRKPKTR
jgi:uncharacterized membrane protein YcaP (DUF421 family)